MKISTAFSDAGKTCARQFTRVLSFLVIEVCFVLATCCFALFLKDATLKPLAFLCVPAFVFLLLPARENAAHAMQDALEGKAINSTRLISVQNYGGKVLRGMRQTLLLLLWASPLIALIILVRVNMAGKTDGFTVMRSIMAFGNGKLMTGMLYLAAILLATLVILVLGLGLHSGTRHLRALGSEKLMCRQPWKNLWCWLLASLVALLPLLIVLGINIARYLPVLQDLTAVFTGHAELPSTQTTLILLGVGGVLTLPLLPLRSLISAAFVRGAEK